MTFKGISKVFSLENEQQYETIGQFWDEMAMLYGLENLQGLGYDWQDHKMAYAIGLKNACIEGYNVSIELPDYGWKRTEGNTEELQQIYDEIYKDGALQFEIEAFYENGTCEIKYYREKHQ